MYHLKSIKHSRKNQHLNDHYEQYPHGQYPYRQNHVDDVRDGDANSLGVQCYWLRNGELGYVQTLMSK